MTIPPSGVVEAGCDSGAAPVSCGAFGKGPSLEKLVKAVNPPRPPETSTGSTLALEISACETLGIGLSFPKPMTVASEPKFVAVTVTATVSGAPRDDAGWAADVVTVKISTLDDKPVVKMMPLRFVVVIATAALFALVFESVFADILSLSDAVESTRF